MNVLTRKWVREYFDYSKDGYLIVKKHRRGSHYKIGDKYLGFKKSASPASRTKGTYFVTKFFGRQHYIHRLIYLWHFGVMPQCIDHIDRNTTNNKIDNLRTATNKLNQCNRPSKNRTGYRGVVKRPNGRLFLAQISVNNRSLYLGNFQNPKDAARAYDKKAKELFGEFAYLNFP